MPLFLGVEELVKQEAIRYSQLALALGFLNNDSKDVYGTTVDTLGIEIDTLISGIINIFPASPSRQRPHVTRDLLREVSERATYGEDPILRANANAAFTAAFAGFLRIGEFTYKGRHLSDPRRLQAEKPTRRCISISDAGTTLHCSCHGVRQILKIKGYGFL